MCLSNNLNVVDFSEKDIRRSSNKVWPIIYISETSNISFTLLYNYTAQYSVHVFYSDPEPGYNAFLCILKN